MSILATFWAILGESFSDWAEDFGKVEWRSNTSSPRELTRRNVKVLQYDGFMINLSHRCQMPYQICVAIRRALTATLRTVSRWLLQRIRVPLSEEIEGTCKRFSLLLYSLLLPFSFRFRPPKMRNARCKMRLARQLRRFASLEWGSWLPLE